MEDTRSAAPTPHPLRGSGDRPPRVVIVGGGFAGLAAARRLKRKPVDLVLVDRTNHHLFQPLLYQVATAALAPADIARPLREVLRRQRNVTVVMGEMADVDPERGLIRLADGAALRYDRLVVAVGARHSYFGNDQWEPLAPGLKTIQDALDVRSRVLAAFERAERHALEHGHDEEDDGGLTFVVVGAGPTGVEMAGAIAEIAHLTMARNFRRIDPSKTRVLLVEMAPAVLPPFPDDLQESAAEQLRELGVEILVGGRVTAIDERGVELETEGAEGEAAETSRRRIEAAAVIWAAGNEVSDVLASLETERDRQGRVVVEPDLSVPGHPEIFVAGDAAAVRDADGEPVPALAPAAMQQGRHVGDAVRADLAGRVRPTFSYADRGTMATIGRARAVAWIHKLHFGGFPAWLAWSLVHIFFLIGFRNRFVVMFEWIWSYVTQRRSSRLLFERDRS